jgi:cyclomaltodextrinase / maltogenic alpha-amylase / neopullulanase
VAGDGAEGSGNAEDSSNAEGSGNAEAGCGVKTEWKETSAPRGLVCFLHEPFLTTFVPFRFFPMKHLVLISAALATGLSWTSCGEAPAPTGDMHVHGTGTLADTLIHPEWSKNATIYEVNLRQHTPEGTIAAFLPDLDRLKDLGVDILWLMPIHPIGEVNRKGGENKNNYIAEPGSGSLGSPYSVKDYVAVNPDYGTHEDLRALVDGAHQRGMRVILDWVANHSAFDCVWTEEHREFYLLDSVGNLQPPLGTDWWDVAQLDWDGGEDNGLYAAMADAMTFWVTECDVDGFRCDVAEKVPTAFWEKARRQLEAAKPDVFMLAEAEVPEHHNRAFDMSYGWHFHHLTNQVAQGKEPVEVLRAYVKEEAERFPSDAYRMGFVTNHDENSWNGTMEERYGEAGDAMAVLAATLLDMPLIYSGQEAGMTKRLRFFEKDTVMWGNYVKADLYRTLNELHHTHEALWNGDFGGAPEVLSTSVDESVFAFQKIKGESTVVVVLNFSPELRPVTVKGLQEGLSVAMSSKSEGAWVNGQEISGYGYVVLTNPS